jgi:CBS domain-containing membrane protein
MTQACCLLNFVLSPLSFRAVGAYSRARLRCFVGEEVPAMPCKEAMTTEILTAAPDQSVAQAVALMDEHGIRAMPVVDSKNNLVGMFGFDPLLRALLPVSLTIGEHEGLDLRLDYVLHSSSGVAQRLAKLMTRKVSDVMSQELYTVHPETPLWEGVRLLVKYGSPLPVVREESMFLTGIMTAQTATKAFLHIVDLMNEGKRQKT